MHLHAATAVIGIVNLTSKETGVKACLGGFSAVLWLSALLCRQTIDSSQGGESNFVSSVPANDSFLSLRHAERLATPRRQPTRPTASRKPSVSYKATSNIAMLPSTTLHQSWKYHVVLLLVFLGALLLISRLWRWLQSRKACLLHRHFLITGGSSGIGRALARAVIRRGANVTLVARNLGRLHEAKMELREEVISPEQIIHTLSADLTEGETGEAALARGVAEAENMCGPVDYLVNCAGAAVSHRFDETKISDFRHMMEVNYLSAVHTTRAVLPGMTQRGSGSVTFVSSIAGLMGVYGYTAYCPAKFALVGLAQSLRMEVKHRGVHVMVAFPPDTDTPGFAEEERTKPTETKLICSAGGLWSADDVANGLLQDLLEGNVTSTVGLDGFVIRTLCAGMMPPSSLLELVTQVASMGVLRIVGYIYLTRFYGIAARCAAKVKDGKKGN